MRKLTLTVAALLALVGLTVEPSNAQSQRRPGGDADAPERGARGGRDDEGGAYGERRGGPDGRGRGRPQNLLFEALDLNGDSEISAIELRKAAAALKKLDLDKDGKITLEEATPPRPSGEEGGRGGRRRGGGDPQEFVTRMMENDKNGDGKLTPDEVPEQLLPMLKGGDTNGDQAIDAKELAALAEAQGGRFGRGGPGGQRGGPGGGDRGSMAEQMFQRSDSNGDGRLTPDEVPERMHQMLQGSDANGDGAIDAQELAAAMEKMGGRRGGDRGGDRGQRGEGGPEGRQRRPE